MKLCLGTVQLGMDYGVQDDKKPSMKDALALLDTALEYGINTFDTAAAYGEAEKIIGAFLEKNKEQRIDVISKTAAASLKGIDDQHYNGIIVDEIKHSLHLLRIKTLDAYYFHNAVYVHDTQRLKSLCYIKELGLAKHTGISVYSPEEALAAAKSEYIDYIQVPYNPLDQRLDKNDFYHIAKQNGKKIFARSVFLQGLLTMNSSDIPDYAHHTGDVVKRFHQIVQEYGYTPMEGCLAFIKANSLIDYYVIGAINKQQLFEIVNTFHSIKDVPTIYIEQLRKEFLNVDEKIINPVLWRK